MGLQPEPGGTMPLARLARLARALDAALSLEPDGDTSRVTFNEHAPAA